MRPELAEHLLANVMGWNEEDVARERPLLQELASLKYDDYHNFSPGMRFTESLAVWLSQFGNGAERTLAYRFVIDRLVYFSDDEMTHFVGMAFPDFIRRKLLVKLAREVGKSEGDLVSAPETEAFRKLTRSTVFAGMSDGARIDTFRRFNPKLSNEQVSPSYFEAAHRAPEMLRKLAEDTEASITGPPGSEPRFRVLVLLDDFSASGYTCSSKLDRVVAKIATTTRSEGLFDFTDLEIIVIQYVATERALSVVKQRVEAALRAEKLNVPFSIEAVQLLSDTATVDPSTTPGLTALLEKYFDPRIVDTHYEKGKHDRPYLGFDECSLPVVLAHNTPNDSLPLLWFYEWSSVRGLFPRITRHGARV